MSPNSREHKKLSSKPSLLVSRKFGPKKDIPAQGVAWFTFFWSFFEKKFLKKKFNFLYSLNIHDDHIFHAFFSCDITKKMHPTSKKKFFYFWINSFLVRINESKLARTPKTFMKDFILGVVEVWSKKKHPGTGGSVIHFFLKFFSKKNFF